MAHGLPSDLVAELLGVLAQRDGASLRIALLDYKAELKARVAEVALQVTCKTIVGAWPPIPQSQCMPS